MPYRRRVSYRRGMAPVVNSIKNIHNAQFGISAALFTVDLAKAVTSPSPTVTNDVSHGCVIKAIWISLDVCGLGGTGVLNTFHAYLMKNPGANLTPPLPISQGGSNEKKFIFKSWTEMIMRNQDGNLPYHWEGWVKIPKRYQRMGTDDEISYNIACTSGVTGHASISAIYKWYR